jgi:hypothetical protein
MWAWVTVAVALTLGCGPAGRGLPMAKVKGTVKYAGGNIPEGKVVFQHLSGEMTGIDFGADGVYELDVPVGKNKVMVTSLVSNMSEGAPGSGRQMEMFTNRLPDKYANFDSSGLEVDVAASGTTFDVNLTD